MLARAFMIAIVFSYPENMAMRYQESVDGKSDGNSLKQEVPIESELALMFQLTSYNNLVPNTPYLSMVNTSLILFLAPVHALSAYLITMTIQERHEANSICRCTFYNLRQSEQKLTFCKFLFRWSTLNYIRKISYAIARWEGSCPY